MRVFMTGATGFIGSAVVEELKAAGHQIEGLARSDAAAATLVGWGVAARRGDVGQPQILAEAAAAADGVIHCAFGNDFSQYIQAGETDLAAVTAMAEALAGSGKPLVVTSGLTARTPGRPSTEADAADLDSMTAVRGRPEEAALAFAARGVRASVVRLSPSVHDRAQQGLVSMLVAAARGGGFAAYVGEGQNRWPAVHRRDAARLFRLALEDAQPGQRLHAVGEEGVRLRDIAEVIGARLGLPVRGLTPEEAAAQLGFVGFVAVTDMPASSALTRESLGWRPEHPGLIAGLRGDYLD
ncbi:SDR family oxidoreductase [Caulobacter sp. KR2-114]|uniref:SDR family oxidoreductase n=1 Tax=Caulobacter sp. KR2-114 TaxID=3400912 RepID=UPI003BFD9C2F